MRSVADRVAAHQHMARRYPNRGLPGTLADAIRQSLAKGLSFDQAFSVKVLDEAATPAAARALERDWIKRLRTAYPAGYNRMPGGSSLGGPANAAPVTIHHRRHGRMVFPSLMQAVDSINRQREAAGRSLLKLGGVYARRATGWSPEESLELVSRLDRRRVRAPFRWHGKIYQTLDELASAEGIKLPTARSRLYRAQQAGCGDDHDAAVDRRRPGPWRSRGVGCGRVPTLDLPHPTDAAAAPVTAEAFARLSGVPKATVLTRYHRLRAAHPHLDQVDRESMLEALLKTCERRIPIELPLPTGVVLRGGVRAVIRQVLSDPEIVDQRPDQVSQSAIRARLRRIPGWPGQADAGAIAWAFGFRPDLRPAAPGGTVL